MKNVVDKVTEFYNAMGDGAHVKSVPQIIDNVDRRALKIRLIQEELNETEGALNDGDIVEVADGIADLIYVVVGLAIESGLGDRLPAIFDEVHRSNMSKQVRSANPAKVVEETERKYAESGLSCYFDRDSMVMRRTSDGKILKPTTYSKADIASIINLRNDPYQITPSDIKEADRPTTEKKSVWKTIETEGQPNGSFITQAIEVDNGTLLRIKAYNRAGQIQGIELQYVPGLEIEERAEAQEEGLIVSYHLKSFMQH